ncbi:MAG: energy transducer TonB, partial [Thermodesulfobacteriota bacterium]
KPEKKPEKVNKEILRDHKLSSLPQQKWLKDKTQKPKKDLKEIGKELAQSTPGQVPSPFQSNLPPKIGAKHVQNKEDTVDLNTTQFKYYSYFLGLKKQIEGVWHYPRDAALRGEHGSLNLIFTIASNGYLEDVKIVHSSGFVSLDKEAVRAIRVASPYHPFPKSWAGLERLNVKATFEYTYRNFIR